VATDRILDPLSAKQSTRPSQILIQISSQRCPPWKRVELPEALGDSLNSRSEFQLFTVILRETPEQRQATRVK
jgi:hypothetical protein